ncbi:hypothetical protein MMC09_003317 [Bachmanniomyces sp. S44760]|nr:hypothetical protein [Bachmanniomyces sp. S44760]
MEAEKIKKKLNGSILKGSRMSVEEARPKKSPKRVRDSDEVDDSVRAEKKVRKASKKEKPKEGVITGIELPDERRVKRGWTEPSSKGDGKKVKRKRLDADEEKGKKLKAVKPQPSSFTDKPELLFKTHVPASKVSSSSKGSKVAKSKTSKGKSGKDVVVNEFANTTKAATFLRSAKGPDGKKTITNYVDGKGWIDENGNIVEPGPPQKHGKSPPTVLAQDTDGTSSSGSDTDLHDEVSVSETHPQSSKSNEAFKKLSSETSSSYASSDSGDKDNSVGTRLQSTVAMKNGNSPINVTKPLASGKTELEDMHDQSQSDATSRNETSGSESDSSRAGSVSDGQDVTEPIADTDSNVHPFEKLFKKPQRKESDASRRPSLEVRTSFSFFDPEIQDDVPPTSQIIPQTPFTRQDFQERRLRSAAPTPDTAAPNKSGFGNVWGSAVSSEEEEDDDDDETGKKKPTSTPLAGKLSAQGSKGDEGAPKESEFSKWFWEHRGETNRAWKRRRREAGKEQRQREKRQKAKARI